MATASTNGAAAGSVKSATRTLDIIEYVVAAGRPLVAQEISNALAIPVSSLSYLLSTLVERTYLQRAGGATRRDPASNGSRHTMAASHSETGSRRWCARCACN